MVNCHIDMEKKTSCQDNNSHGTHVVVVGTIAIKNHRRRVEEVMGMVQNIQIVAVTIFGENGETNIPIASKVSEYIIYSRKCKRRRRCSFKYWRAQCNRNAFRRKAIIR